MKLAIGHQRRFLPSYTLAKELIAQKAIGDVNLIQSMGGAGLPNYSSHQADMYRYLLSDDECVWVMGNIERKTDQHERATRIEDRAMAVFQFAGGTAGDDPQRSCPELLSRRADLWKRRHDQLDH